MALDAVLNDDVRVHQVEPTVGGTDDDPVGGWASRTLDYAPSTRRKGSGVREIGDGTIVTGTTGIAALVKAGEIDEPDSLEKARAGSERVEAGWLFAKPNGEPLNLNSDYVEWRGLLKRAGVRRVRLHDARHTAASFLPALDVPARTVMEIMGWSSISMTSRYQHVSDPIRLGVADRVGDLLFDDALGSEEGPGNN